MKIMLKSATWSMLAALLILAAVSCGKKGPPEVSRQQPLPVAENLSADLRESTIVLEWTLPQDWQKDYARPGSFIVYRAKISIEEDCPDCPLRFKNRGEVALRNGRSLPETWKFEDRAEPGYVYRYRIRCYGEKGSRGEASETVKFKFTRDSGSGSGK